MQRLAVLCFLFVVVSGYPNVQSLLGNITGVVSTVLDVEIESFLAIPYAKPPINDLRFALPQAFGSVGNLDATKYSPQCPQFNIFEAELGTLPEDEDCLYLNVFRLQGTVKSDNKAVIAVVHGGGFHRGSSSEVFQSAAALAGVGDVIVVSFNYRLGVLGFADMGILAPGNLGLHDQRMALQWIQDNIADFGGDAQRVTVMGNSAGSMSIGAQIITPIDERNLFQSAIMDAGVVTSTGYYEDSASSYNRVRIIAEELDCPLDSEEMVDCLREATIDDLVSLADKHRSRNGMTSFVPTTDDLFIPYDLDTYVEENSAKLRKVRLMIGYALNEGTFFVSYGFPSFDFSTKKDKDQIVDYCQIVSEQFGYTLDFDDSRTRKLVRQLYVDKHPGNAYDAVADFQADGTFKCPTNDFITTYSRHNDEIFVYQFERKLTRAYFTLFDPELLGVFHFSPFLHFCGSLFLGEETPHPDDKNFSLDTMELIANFSKTDRAPTFRGIHWPSFSETGNVLVFNETPNLREALPRERQCRELFDGMQPTMSKTEL